MYRIKLTSGEEAVYRTAQELAQAVSSGVVSDTAEVFHKSAGKWLPIKLHPDYRAVVTGKLPAAAPESLVATPSASQPSPGPVPPVPPPAVTAQPEAPEPISGPALKPVTPPSPATPVARAPIGGEATRTGKLRIILAVAIGVLGLGLIGGGIMLAGPRMGHWLAARHRPVLPMSAGMPPESLEPPSAEPEAELPRPSQPTVEAPGRLDTIPSVSPAPSAPIAGSPPAADSAVSPSAATRVSRLSTTRARLPSYYEAYADARAEMDDGLDYVGFRHLFAPERFVTPESLRAAQRTVEAASNILRVYRGQEVMLEQTYRPDDPGGLGTLREPFETAETARSLLSDVDSLFGLLVRQEGRFGYTNGSIHFQDPKTAQAYNQLRSGIIATLAVWRDSGAAADRVTLPRLLRAFGETVPPPGR